MERSQTQTSNHSPSFFEQRRRLRRVRMIVELTSNLIQNDVCLTHREARCLLQCARKAIAELIPAYNTKFDLLVAPRLNRVMRERWPIEESRTSRPLELVN